MRHDGCVATNEVPESNSKSEMRGQIRKRRAGLSAADRLAAGELIAGHIMPIVLERGSSCVACYFSLPTEPTTDPLLRLLWAADIEVLTPRVRGTALEWVRTDSASKCTSGSFGIREVIGGELRPLTAVDLVIMPALGVSATGARLGQGGGFYDRALGQLESIPLLIAMLFAQADGVDVPAESHDVAVDAVATEQGVRWIM